MITLNDDDNKKVITLNDDDGNLCTEVCFPNDVSVALATFVIADQVNVQLVEHLEEHNGDADAGDGSEHWVTSDCFENGDIDVVVFFSTGEIVAALSVLPQPTAIRS